MKKNLLASAAAAALVIAATSQLPGVATSQRRSRGIEIYPSPYTIKSKEKAQWKQETNRKMR